MDPLQSGDPRSIGRYVLSARLGGGGMGQVFLGRSPGGRPVAVKLLRPEFGTDDQFRRRFAIEVEAARRVGGFFTAQLVDADPAADRPWLVTAYVPGPSLQAAVGQHGPLPVRTVWVLGAGLAEGLAAIHACDLVHRDLKPGNVILASDGPRVIDFGIARAMEAASGTVTGAVAGTPAYMSPEQVRGDPRIGPASDVFSLGSVLAFAATGTGPFGHGPATTVLYRIASAEPDLAGVPGGLRELVAACLAKDPAARPGVPEILDRCATAAGSGDGWLPPHLNAMVTAADVRPEPGHPPPTAAPPRPRTRWITGGVALLAAVALATALTLLALRDNDTTGNAPQDRAAGRTQPPRTTPPAAKSPVTGRIQDRQAGFSFARLGGTWTAANANWIRPGLFTSGQTAVVQAPINGASFNATSVAGVPRPDEIRGYRGPADLPTLAERVRFRVLRELFTVRNNPTTLASGRTSLAGGNQGWLEKIRLDFPDAKTNGWQVTADTIALLLVDRGNGKAGLLVLSTPETFPTPGDLDQVLSSVRIP